MDNHLFVDQAPGELVAIGSGKEFAFVPDPLPDTYVAGPDAVHLWVEARDVIGELRGTARTLPDYNLLLRPLKQREALRSSSLEGTYATPAELLAYQKNPREPTSAHDPANSWREVANYQNALDTGQRLIEEGYPFSEWLIRQLHEQLLSGVRGDNKSPGVIRSTQVHIGAGNRFTPAPVEHLNSLLGQLERAMQSESDMDPLIRALLIHYQFETIHPFRDGNGRIGRLLMALMIYKWCGFDMPWLYLSEYFEEHKDEYIDGLFNVSTKGDWQRWVTFGLRATIETGRATTQRIRKLIALKDEYETRIRNYPGRDRLVHILPLLLSSPIIAYADLKRVLGVTYPTARADMEALSEMKIVRDLDPTASPRLFVAQDIFSIAYLDGT